MRSLPPETVWWTIFATQLSIIPASVEVRHAFRGVASVSFSWGIDVSMVGVEVQVVLQLWCQSPLRKAREKGQ